MDNKNKNIDKRKQFQLNILTNKLSNYLATLKELQENKSQLGEPNINDYKSRHKRHILENEKSRLEAKLAELQTEITNIRSSCMRTINTQKLLPNQLSSNIEKENAIYNEECTMIDEKIVEAKELLESKMNQQVIDKQALEELIKELQMQITNAAQNITEIQATAHVFRKSTLEALQAKKKQKKQVQSQIATIQDTTQHYLQRLFILAEQNQIFLEYKTQLINNFYSISKNQTVNASKDASNDDLKNEQITILEKIKELGINVSQDILAMDGLNPIIDMIDNKILENKKTIDFMDNKASRNNIRNTRIITQLQTSIEPRTRNKVMSYKDSYKLAKLDKNNLEQSAAKLQKELDNWESNVITNIQNTYQDTLNQLEIDRSRALERLNIMTARLNDEHQNTHSQLEEYINIYSNKISDLNNQTKDLLTQIANIKKELEIVDINQTKLEKVNSRITETEKVICLIEKDIASLSV
jgi:chromosome segregation ATPase